MSLWFDLDNSPHVQIFRPILRELLKSGSKCHVTARDYAQTAQLLTLLNVEARLIGTHGGRGVVRKLLNLASRSALLVKAMRGMDVRLGISHGSRTQVLACKLMGVRSLVMLDYEYTESHIFNRLAARILMPELIPDDRLRKAGFDLRKLIRYGGFKEEIYLSDFVPQKGFRRRLGIPDDSIVAIVRPPSILGNYHDTRSESLFVECVRFLSLQPGVRCLIVGRTVRDKDLLRSLSLGTENVSWLDQAVDGLQLLWHSDIVVSGGGTMNREAALLGVPAYSIFTGKRPFLDEYLAAEGKLRFIETAAEIPYISVKRRQAPLTYLGARPQVLSDVLAIIQELERTSSV